MALTKITSRILDSSGVTTVGTISTGVWQGTAINQTYLVGQSGTNTGDETLARINALDITELGTVSSGVWNGTVIASAYLDADTAHLSTTQTFTGAKTFSSNAIFSSNVGIGVTPVSKLHIRTSTNFNYEFEEVSSKLRLSALNDARSANVPLQFAASEFNFITGNVGIGTTSPTQAKLVIIDSDASKQIVFSDHVTYYGSISHNAGTGLNEYRTEATGGHAFYKGTSSTPQLTILANGNVGVGTTSPTSKIHVVDSSNGGAIKIAGAVTDTSAAYYGFMYDGTDLRGTTQVNLFYAGGAIKASTTITDFASFRIDAPSLSASGSAITNNYAIYQASSLQKNYFGGNLGIGTTSPSWKLTVSDGTITGFINPFNSYFNIGAATSHGLKLYAGGDARVTIASGGDVTLNGNGTTSALLFGQSSFARIINTSGQILYVDSDTHEFRTSGGVGKLIISSAGKAHFTPSGEFAALFENTNTTAGQHCYVDIESNGGSNGLAILRFITANGLCAIYGDQNNLKFNTNNATRLTIASGGDATFSGSVSAVRLFSASGGNATNPMIAPSDDQDTGIFFPSANTMAFTAGNAERLRIEAGGTVSANNVFSQNSVGRRCNSGSTTGNASFYVDYTVSNQSSLKVTAVFNHYGYITSYGCARFSLVGLGPVITTVDISTTTSGNGGSWSFSRINNTTLRVTKNAGSYAGGGYYFIEVIGAQVL